VDNALRLAPAFPACTLDPRDKPEDDTAGKASAHRSRCWHGRAQHPHPSS